MDYIDTHCHLDSILAKLETPDFPTFRSQFLPSNFGGCITISCDPLSIGPTLALMRQEGVSGAFGIHPHDAQAYGPELEASLVEAMADKKTVAWGEIGLDYHYDFSPRGIQREVFARQIRKGVECGKPLIIHTREAEEDTLSIMTAEIPGDWKVHVHCFTSSPDMAEKLLARFPNLCLGFTGIVTFKNALELQSVAVATPLNRILLETDGPYLAPIPHRGKPAHPGHIPLIAQKIAELKGAGLEDVYAAARENTRRVYGI
jgi:TatD DNase family protein